METKINVAEILKDKPQGTKLYSSACGKCKLEEVDDKSFKISFYNSKFGFMNGGEGYLDKNGKLYDDGECVVFPSKEMRDWSKFAWKKGDVLVTEDGSTKAIFESFEDDTYLTFKGKYCLQKTNIDETFIVDTKKNLTECFSLQAKNIAQIYIHNIEDRMGGILNMETLEIEKAQPKFKDGDIITFKNRIIIIYNTSIEKSPIRTEIYYHACLKEGELTVNEYLMSCGFGEGWYSSTEEKQKLFDALAKDGKAWDAEKKMIVDLKPKVELKPFDKVLVRDGKDEIWEPAFFFRNLSHLNVYNYQTVGGESRVYCIPFNEETAKLIGTTDDWEG